MDPRRFIILYLAFLPVVTGYVQAQNERAAGYQSLWSKSSPLPDYGFRYSGGMGTFSAQHKPLAIYSEKADKTFFVYSGTSHPDSSHLRIMVSYFDHRTRKVPRPVIVFDKMGVNDPQDNASISMDSRGYVWIFVSGRARTRPGIIFKSTTPYSIDSFDKMFEGEIVFPQPWWMNDSCFMLMHTRVTKGRELYWTSSTDGRNWIPGQKLAGMGGHHQVTGVYGNKLVSVFSWLPGGNIDNRTNIYFLQTDNFGKTWKTITGNIVSTPLTDINSEALVKDFASEKKLVYLKDLNFDSEGNPVILALISRDSRPGPQGDPREWMVIHWMDGRWTFSKVCESSHNYDMGPIYTEGTEWHILAPTSPGPQKNKTGGELDLWTSSDSGLSWTKSKSVTSGSKWNNSYVRRPLNAHRDFYAFWTDGNPDAISESHIYFTNRECDKVWVLPYRMNKDYEKPQRIR